MRLAFMGSPAFAVPSLCALSRAGHELVAVYCQPPRPAGRGQRLQRSAVHDAALELGLCVRTPARLRGDPAEQTAFAALGLDATVVAAYGQILPQAMLDAPRRGCLNIHASLLPRWRGAAPIQAAILAGDAETGITIMQMEAALDSGPILLQEAVPIGSGTTGRTLHEALAALGAALIVRVLAEQPTPLVQPAEGVCYAPKLTRADARIDWTRAAVALERQVRALDAWPGTYTTWGGATLKVLSASVVEGTGPPGLVLDDHLAVACGSGALRLTRLQLAGRPARNAEAFLRGHRIQPGTRLGC